MRTLFATQRSYAFGVVAPLAFGAAYFALSRIGLAFLSDGHVALLWPASGLALAVFLSTPRRRWGRLAAVVLVANLLAQWWARGIATPAVLGLAAVNALEPLLGALAIQAISRTRERLILESTREVAGLIVAATLANAVTATLGAAVVASAFDAPFGVSWEQWWLSDGIGMLAIAPVAMAWRRRRPERVDLRSLSYIAAAWLTAALVFWRPLVDAPTFLRYSYATLPLLLWVAVRCGARAAALALAGVSTIAVTATVAGEGPFAHAAARGLDQAGALQGYLAAVIVSTLFVATVVAERQRAEDELGTIFESSPAGNCVVAAGRIVRTNRALAQLTGRSGEQLCELAAGELVHARDRDALEQAIAGVCAGTSATAELEAALPGAADDDGATVAISVVPLATDSGTRALLHILDVSERRRFEDELRHLADHDPLTGLANRRRFATDLDRQVDLAQRYGTPAAVILLDVDHFKQINDSYGHTVGDKLIVSVAEVLQARLRASDVIARLGGDEFAILLPNVDRDGAETVARQLVHEVATHAARIDARLLPPVTISVGVAHFEQQPGLSRETIVMEADVAMYEAKESGRNRYALSAAGVAGTV